MSTHRSKPRRSTAPRRSWDDWATIIADAHRRDGGCVAARLGWTHVCRDRLGDAHGATALDRLEHDHVQEGYGRAGKRADDARVVTLCSYAHQASGWATANRPVLRLWIDGERRWSVLREAMVEPGRKYPRDAESS